MILNEEELEKVVGATYLVFKVVSWPPHSRAGLENMCRVATQHIRSSAVPNNKSVRVEVRKESWTFSLKIKQNKQNKNGLTLRLV